MIERMSAFYPAFSFLYIVMRIFLLKIMKIPYLKNIMKLKENRETLWYNHINNGVYIVILSWRYLDAECK